MASVFTKIIEGEIPSYTVAEDDFCYAFLDINPNTKGHTLCVPKKEVDKLFDLDEMEYSRLMSFSRKVAIAIEAVVHCKRVGMAVVGLEVPHAHIHLIPIHSIGDMNFSQKEEMLPEEFAELAAAIQAKL
ncbi:MAG: HIT family protein [Flavobacteriaceae bacterium]|nr:HIT family protein [Flavobacteriaceae bacterium]